MRKNAQLNEKNLVIGVLENTASQRTFSLLYDKQYGTTHPVTVKQPLPAFKPLPEPLVSTFNDSNTNQD